MLLKMKELPALEKSNERFRFARTALTKLTQKQVADAFGVSPQAVSQWERGEDAPTARNLEKMAELYNVPMDWLTRRPGSHIMGNTERKGARVPLVSRIAAGLWSPTWNPYEPGYSDSFLHTDQQISDQAFALELDGSSMEPEFRSGDTVIIDPRVTARPGDFVAAKIDDHDEATFKKYRPRGGGVIELVPLNPDWPILVIDSDHPGTIIGTMVEHRRYRRR